MKWLQQAGYLVLLVLAIPLAYNALTYANFSSTYGFLRLKQAAIETGWYLPAYYAHVLLAGIILPLGLFQVHPDWGQRWASVHRLLGKVYVLGVVLLAAPGGLIMSFFIGRGPWVLTSFVLQSLCWILFTSWAYVQIRRGNTARHRRWMLRSYALAMAAITLRVYAFIASWSIDLSNPPAYALIAWLSWIPNLIMVEVYLWVSASSAKPGP